MGKHHELLIFDYRNKMIAPSKIGYNVIKTHPPIEFADLDKKIKEHKDIIESVEGKLIKFGIPCKSKT
ncbi:MAG: hypothetical protein ACTSXJ_08415 [Candidatus Baldrarchaeia archaeon]